MWQKLIVSIVLGLLAWLEKQHDKSKTAVDADRRADALRRIGERVRLWQDRASAGRQPDPGGAGDDGEGVPLD